MYISELHEEIDFLPHTNIKISIYYQEYISLSYNNKVP